MESWLLMWLTTADAVPFAMTDWQLRLIISSLTHRGAQTTSGTSDRYATLATSLNQPKKRTGHAATATILDEVYTWQRP